MLRFSVHSAAVTAFLTLISLAGCQKESGAGASSPPPTAPAQPTGPAPAAPAAPGEAEIVTHLFPDGHWVALDKAHGEAVLVPNTLTGKFDLYMINANIGFFPRSNGATLTAACTDYRARVEDYLTALRQATTTEERKENSDILKILLSDGTHDVGAARLTLELESDAFAKNYLQTNWPATLPPAARFRALRQTDLIFDVTGSTIERTLNWASGEPKTQFFHQIALQPATAYMNPVCDLLLGHARLQFSTRRFGGRIPLSVAEKLD